MTGSERRRYRTLARSNGGEPDAGRHLLAWAHQAGLSDLVATSTNWTYSGPSALWWGRNWAERVHSSLGTQLVDTGLATPAEVNEVAQAWIDWAEHPDAWFAAPSAEIVATH